MSSHSTSSPRAASTDRIRSQYNAAVLAAGMSASVGGGSVSGGVTNTVQLSSASSVVSGDVGNDVGGGQLDTSLQLQLLFQYYCRFGRTGRETEIETLDNVMWAKFCRDTPGLLDRRVTPTEADLIFVKVKSKHSRRVDYNQWLDMLAAIASIKYGGDAGSDYGDSEDGASPNTRAFSSFLSTNVLANPAAIGIAQAVVSGLLTLSPTPLRSTSASRSASAPRSASASRSNSLLRPGSAGGGPSPRSPSVSRALAGASSGSGGGVSPTARSVTPSASARLSASAKSLNVRSPSPGPSRAAVPSTPVSYAAYMQAAAAQMAALAAQAQSAADAVSAAAAGASVDDGVWSNGGGGAGAGANVPPAAAYEVLARKALELQTAAAAASAASLPASPRSGSVSHSFLGSVGGGMGAGASSAASAAQSTRGSVVSRADAAPTGRVGGLASPSPFRAVTRDGDFFISAQSLGVAGSGASRPGSAQRSPGGNRYSSMGTSAFRASIAGESNAPGSIFDRLSNPESFTGVYRRAWETDGRINQYTETGATTRPSRFLGHTNTGSDEHITDISVLMRPNLLVGGPTSFRVNNTQGTPKKTPRRA